MPPRKVPLALVEPDAHLTSWKVFETADEGKHLVGRDSLGTGCVAPYLVAFGRKTMRAKSRSGERVSTRRRARLLFLHIVDVWEAWSEANFIGTVTKNITEQLLAVPTEADQSSVPRSG